MIIKRFFKKLADKAFSATLKRVGFWSGEIYDFSVNNDQACLTRSAASPRGKWLMVVGRNGYFETTKDYPIGHLGDVKKALKNESWRFPYQGVRLDIIERLNDQAHRVTSWVVKQEVLDSFENRPLWIFPESACYAGLARNSPVALERLGQTVYVAKSVDGLVSSLGSEEAFLRRVITITQREEPTDPVFERLTGSMAVESILLGVMNSIRAFPLRFFIGVDGGSYSVDSLFGAAKLSAAILVTYLAMSSGYLMISNSWVDYRLATNSLKAESAVELRGEVNGHQSKIADFNAISSDVYPMWIAWDILLDLEKLGVSFRAVNSSFPVVTYYVTVARATDVLAWLSDDLRVSKVEVVVPVRKIKGSEQFAVEVTIRRDAANERLGVLGGL
ncbi:MAG: Uncharacterised protein [Porticoccaceae bacterium UBA1117]|nr:MAG: Uncharacterised protein [Porticoccaceae bacterium UBA1117]